MNTQRQKMLDQHLIQLRTGLSLLGTKQAQSVSPNPTENPLPPVSLNLNPIQNATQEITE